MSAAKNLVCLQECNWNGELTAEGCHCIEGYGGLDCSVESTSEGCFTGERANGERPEGLTACNTCYKCNDGPATVREDGVVTKGGNERCLLHSGKESLCLSCPEGAGLMRLGDQGAGWGEGYKQMGECRKLPRASIKVASDQQMTHRMACEQQCHPTRSTVFAESKLNWCSKVRCHRRSCWCKTGVYRCVVGGTSSKSRVRATAMLMWLSSVVLSKIFTATPVQTALLLTSHLRPINASLTRKSSPRQSALPRVAPPLTVRVGDKTRRGFTSR